eukprot:6176650-Pleurochrysis_carterae.AAC.2
MFQRALINQQGHQLVQSACIPLNIRQHRQLTVTAKEFQATKLTCLAQFISSSVAPAVTRCAVARP